MLRSVMRDIVLFRLTGQRTCLSRTRLTLIPLDIPMLFINVKARTEPALSEVEGFGMTTNAASGGEFDPEKFMFS